MLNKRIQSSEECTSNFNITSGYSPDLQKFIRSCQSVLIKPSSSHGKFYNTNQENHNNINIKITTSKIANNLIKPNSKYTTKFSKIVKQTPSNNFKYEGISKKNYHSINNNINNNDIITNNKLIDQAKILCKDYLLEEMVYKQISSINKNANLNIDSIESKNNKIIPKLCADYIYLLNQTQSKNSNHDNSDKNINNSNNNNNMEYLLNYEESLNGNGRYKKCYALRNTPSYKQCMNKYYKCYQFNNDIENLKKCRKKYGITVPPRKKNNFY